MSKWLRQKYIFKYAVVAQFKKIRFLYKITHAIDWFVVIDTLFFILKNIFFCNMLIKGIQHQNSFKKVKKHFYLPIRRGIIEVD